MICLVRHTECEEKLKEQEQRIAGGARHRAGCVTCLQGWRLFHAVARYGARTGEGARPRLLLQALEWLLAALAGPDAAAIEAACVPETEAELERHRVVRRAAGGTAELWALTDFDAIVCADANYWARTQARVTDEERRAAGAVLQLLHREIGNVGHYDLLGTNAMSPQPFARTCCVRLWEGSHAGSARNAKAAQRLQFLEWRQTSGPSQKPTVTCLSDIKLRQNRHGNQ